MVLLSWQHFPSLDSIAINLNRVIKLNNVRVKKGDFWIPNYPVSDDIFPFLVDLEHYNHIFQDRQHFGMEKWIALLMDYARNRTARDSYEGKATVQFYHKSDFARVPDNLPSYPVSGSSPYDYGLIFSNFIRCKPFAIPFVHPNPTTLGIVRLRNSYEDEDFIILPDHHLIRPFSALLTYIPEEVFPN